MLENICNLEEGALEEVNGGVFSGECFVYIIKKGDCLSNIAKQYDTSVDLLCTINNITDANLIYEGSRLLIPLKD